ncbi:MAG: TRAM domain-containing protein [Candidatus Hinthialibacter antarcticus]|nr:TRAM domain-containing protein [Candidatus Hinthialibacter antarcticus]
MTYIKNPKSTNEKSGDTPFLVCVRVVFVFIFTYIIYTFALAINPFIVKNDLWVYCLVGFSFATIFVILESQVRYFYPQSLFFGLLGLSCGLAASLLIQAALPSGLGVIPRDLTRLVLHLFLGYFGVTTGLRYANRFDFTATKLLARSEDRLYGSKMIDTSILIDGRIAELLDAGFLEGHLVIPGFVLNELQTLADSSDHNKRSKGRRGLDISKRILNAADGSIEVLEEDFPNFQEVDKKLIALTKKYEGTLLTLDFNLSKVAEIENLGVLNINLLAQSLKTVVMPGDDLQVQVLKDGKEPSQGVGYLDDGTMIVVENGKKLIGQNVHVNVSSVLQTSAGRLIFTKPIELEYKNPST